MFLIKNDVLEQAVITLPRFLKRIDPLFDNFKITNRGVWTSECFALCVMIDLFGIDVYLESGVYNGQSAFNISKYFEYEDNFLLMCFDIDVKTELRERLTKGRFQTYIEEGDGLKLIPSLCKTGNTKRGIFIDGPKGWDALKLAEKVIDNNNVKFIGIHDTYLPVDIQDDHYKFRKHLENKFHTWSTDDADFVKLYNHLDNIRWMEYLEEEQLGGILPYNKIKFLHDENKYESQLLKSYGPTITFIWKK